MMKKCLAIVLCMALGCATLVGCGKKTEEVVPATTENVNTTQAQTTTTKANNAQTSANVQSTGANGKVVPGSNMNNAILMPLGTKAFGSIEPKSYAWFAFNTGSSTDGNYCVTFVNATEGSEDLNGCLFDEYGQDMLEDHSYGKNAGQSGTPTTLTGKQALKPNTTYYVRLYSKNEKKAMEYSIIIKDSNSKNTAIKTVGSLSQSVGEQNQQNGSKPGTNQSAATPIPFETKATGTIQPNKYMWFSFTTGDNEDAKYNVTFVNGTVGSEKLNCDIFNEYGYDMLEDHSYGKNADQSGTPVTMNSKNELKPNTTYYVRMYSKDEKKAIDYSLVVKPSVPVTKTSTLVFEVPFELNEVQLQFNPNTATLIDEAKAKEALKPVADVILKNPGHSILIAGTTATEGTQASCVTLSVQRAETVKKILIDTYKVPESQLKTIGLGYEKDPFERGQDRDANNKEIESEAKKNRRVVILDADDPIAKDLMAK